MAKTPIEQLQVLLLEGKVIPVIGAGVSAAVAALPGWKGTIDQGFQFAKNRNLDEKEISKGRLLLESGQLTASADILKKLLNAPANPFATWLDQLFGSPNIGDPQLLFHIHELCCPIILTTNYDNLISESVLIGNKLVYDWSEYQEVLRALELSKEFIFHLHGRIHKPETIILSAGDYKALAKQQGYKAVLQHLWMNYHFLFIGCSRDGVLDDDFITILNFLNKWFPYSPHQHFILMNEHDIEKGDHKVLLRSFNIETINYGKEYSQLSPAIAKVNPNRKKLLERINMAVIAYLKIDQDVPRNITEILANSHQYKVLTDRLQHLRRKLESSYHNGNEYFTLNNEIDALEESVFQYRKALLALMEQLNDTYTNTERFTIACKLLGEGKIESAIQSLKQEELEREAQELISRREHLNKEQHVLDERAKNLSQEYQLKASLTLLNLEDSDRVETAIALVDRSVTITDDKECLMDAARFYGRMVELPERAVSICERILINLGANSIDKILLYYDIGTYALSTDLPTAEKYLTEFCQGMKKMHIDDPHILTLQANGLHNLSNVYEEHYRGIEVLDEAITLRRRAAVGDPIYLPLLTYSLNKKCAAYFLDETGMFERTFNDSFNAMETFLSMPPQKSVPFFEEQCLATLILFVMRYRYFKKDEEIYFLRTKIETLLKQFDGFITSFDEESNLGVANAYHQYFMVFSGIDLSSKSSQWMMERSIFHYEKALRIILPTMISISGWLMHSV